MTAGSSDRSILPGFGPALGYSMLYLGAIVLIPLSSVFLKTATGGWAHFWGVVTSPAVVASYRISFGASLGAALINAVFGVAGGLGPGALPVPRQASGGRRRGHPLRAARPPWRASR